MSINPEEQDPAKKQSQGKAPRKRPTLREAAANEERFRRRLDTYVKRNPDGTFAEGTPSPNPHGPKPKGRRMFGMTQTAKDLLELLEQPVTITKGKKKKQVPAIVAIYDKMIHMAIAGDWQAMRKCVELRERYSDFREETLKKLLGEAQNLRQRYRDEGQKMPVDVENFVEFIELNVAYGQYRAA